MLEPTKKISHIQRQRRSYSDMVGEVQSLQNQIQYLQGGWPSNWRTMIPKKFSHRCKGSEPHVRLPNLGSDKGMRNPLGIWPWRPERFDFRISGGLGGTETPLLEGSNKTLCTPRLRGKEQWLHRRWNQSYLLVVLEGLLWRHGLAGAQHRDRGTGSSSLEKSHLV